MKKAAKDIPDRPRRSGVQSIEIGGRLLEAMVGLGAPAALSEIAEAANLLPAKAHRYLTSLGEIGLTMQHNDTGRYGLGPLALRMGLSALSQHDIMDRAHEMMTDLCNSLKTSGHLSVWSEAGPVVIRSAHGGPPVISPVAVGTILPLLRSATGRVYLSHMPQLSAADAQQLQPTHDAMQEEELASVRREILKTGYALAKGNYIPGLCAIGVPILNHDQTIAGALTLVSTDTSTFTEESAPTQRVCTAVKILHSEWSPAQLSPESRTE